VFEQRAAETLMSMRSSAMPRPDSFRRGVAVGDAQTTRIAEQERAVAERVEATARIASRRVEVARRARGDEHCYEWCTVDEDVPDGAWIGCSGCGVFVHDRCVTDVSPDLLAELKASRKHFYCIECRRLDARKRRKS
jgi:hypothetical protein